jgi:hypothetical protein
VGKKSLDNIFDDNVLTYVMFFPYEEGLDFDMDEQIAYKTPPDSFWVGMDIGKPVRIEMVGYCPKNNKNNIYPGMNYELMYWDDRWISLGIKQTETDSVTFDNIPAGALILLNCLDEGKEIRISRIDENGRQVWWLRHRIDGFFDIVSVLNTYNGWLITCCYSVVI